MSPPSDDSLQGLASRQGGVASATNNPERTTSALTQRRCREPIMREGQAVTRLTLIENDLLTAQPVVRPMRSIARDLDPGPVLGMGPSTCKALRG